MMCENIRVEIGGCDYEDAVLQAMIKIKGVIPEDCSVFRDPDECSVDDWFLRHSDCELSLGGTQVGGLFVFTRIVAEVE